MRSERLGMEHKELLQRGLKGLETAISEYSFANLYLFRHDHDYEVLFDKELFIKGRTYDGRTYIMPVFDIRKSDIGRVKSLLADGTQSR